MFKITLHKCGFDHKLSAWQPSALPLILLDLRICYAIKLFHLYPNTKSTSLLNVLNKSFSSKLNKLFFYFWHYIQIIQPVFGIDDGGILSNMYSSTVHAI